jgi:excinuclease UvrABC ATPase subunit
MDTRDDSIRISGAREHNLRDISLRLPKNQITVFTGVSGSGKSSVVFDTVAVESQRQLNETFTWFIRNRLPRYERPKVDSVENLTAAVVVDQKPVGGNARSTVGTMTDVYSVLRVLFSRCGSPSAGESTAYSFNDPQGMCPDCSGLGNVVRPDLGKLLDTTKTLNDGAILFPHASVGSWWWSLYARTNLFDPDKTLAAFTSDEWEQFLYGTGFRVEGTKHSNTYDGLVSRFQRLYINEDKHKKLVREFTHTEPCAACHGARLNPAALATELDGHTIADLAALECGELARTLRQISDPVGKPIAAAAVASLERIVVVGLGYLSLDRSTETLSGGEGQRLKTVRHLGSSLTGMTYIFDEPSIGLHPRDVRKLNTLLLQLRDKGNTVLIVEHDRDVIAIADHVVDMGPGAGQHGGTVVFEGTVKELAAADTPTGRGLNRTVPFKDSPREPTGWLSVDNADLHNLKNVSVRFPTGVLTAVTGVAGSGKSTLVNDVFCAEHPETIVVDQSAITGSIRSTPATYLGVMDTFRRIFAKANNVDAGLFSFNSKGACPACQGRGEIFTDLAFMDPVTAPCTACDGRRFSDDVLRHTVRGASIADVLDFTAEQCADFFTGEPGGSDVRRKLQTLADVGLDYLTLGQSLSSLSGGERQRIKLATRLHRNGSVYVLDEPTTGLHMSDVDGLVALLDKLVDDGNTVIVIEHNMDVVRRADWVVDLGPEGGRRGGEILYTGVPAGMTGTPTAEHLHQ